MNFYEKYPHFKGRKVYITGESYAGHYIPYITDHILEDEKFEKAGIIIGGVAIGNGWVRPYEQYDGYSSFAYNNELINATAKVALDAAFAFCKILVKYNIPIVSIMVCNISTMSILGIPLMPRFNTYDIRIPCEKPPLCYDFSPLDVFLNRADVQEELGVPGRSWTSCNMKVRLMMFNDWMTDAGDQIKRILKRGKKVLIYSGDKDFICNWEGTEIWVH